MVIFLSTPSGWRATQLRTKLYNYRRTISIHALRVEGDGVGMNPYRQRIIISIHALRVEGDYSYAENADMAADISIHALRVEGDA